MDERPWHRSRAFYAFASRRGEGPVPGPGHDAVDQHLGIVRRGRIREDHDPAHGHRRIASQRCRDDDVARRDGGLHRIAGG